MPVDLQDPASVGTEIIRLGTLLRMGNYGALPESFRQHGYTLIAAAIEPRVIKRMETNEDSLPVRCIGGDIVGQVTTMSEVSFFLHPVFFPAH